MKIYGASGHGGVILESILSSNGHVECFIDDAPKSEFLGLDVQTSDCLGEFDEIIIAIGDNGVRQKIVKRLEHRVFKNAIHSSAVISNHTVLGYGIAVMAGVVVNQGASIGNHVILNTNCSVDHDCTIDDFVHISPGATLCGGIKIGEGTLIGAGAIILPNLIIGKNVVVGAGAVVTQNISSETKVAGIPARLI